MGCGKPPPTTILDKAKAAATAATSKQQPAAKPQGEAANTNTDLAITALEDKVARTIEVWGANSEEAARASSKLQEAQAAAAKAAEQATPTEKSLRNRYQRLEAEERRKAQKLADLETQKADIDRQINEAKQSHQKTTESLQKAKEALEAHQVQQDAGRQPDEVFPTWWSGLPQDARQEARWQQALQSHRKDVKEAAELAAQEVAKAVPVAGPDPPVELDEEGDETMGDIADDDLPEGMLEKLTALGEQSQALPPDQQAKKRGEITKLVGQCLRHVRSKQAKQKKRT